MTEPTGSPEAGRGSPPPPPGIHDFTIREGKPIAVAVDTSVVLNGSARLPLAASAAGGHLAVYWSTSIQREIAKVAYRLAILAALRSAPARTDANERSIIRQTIDRAAIAIEAQMSELERWFIFSSIPDTADESLLDVVADEADRHVLRAARGGQVSILLSLDQRHFSHGVTYHGVQCWHPDTFLTLFYRQNRDAYDYAARSVNDLPIAVIHRLVP